MATHGVRVAFDALAASNRSLLTADADHILQYYRMSWATPAGACTPTAAITRGVWLNADQLPLRPIVLGVVNAERSCLGPYGTLAETSDPVTRRDLQKARFTVDITYPSIPPGHLDDDIEAGLVNQLYCLDDIRNAASAQLLAQGHPAPVKLTNWVNCRHTSRQTSGSMRVFLGPVYETALGANGDVPDIEDDPNMYHGPQGSISPHCLRHNSALPCFTAAGLPIGRTSAELRHELYHGRWVKIELDMNMWNLAQEGHRIFQLNARRLETLNAPPATVVGSWTGFNPGSPGA